jgi:large subunit ribosomal protein L25
MDTTTVTAQVRETFGKGAARKLRAAAKVPAIIYREGHTPRHVVVDGRELRLIFEKSGNPNMVLAIDMGEDTITVILKDAQKHPVSREILHLDFYQVVEGVSVTVKVPITTSGKSKGAIRGGKLRMLRYTVGITCAPEDIPTAIDVDLSTMDIGDFLRASAITPPAGGVVTFEHDYNILTIVGKSKAAVAEDLAAEAEAAAALVDTEG